MGLLNKSGRASAYVIFVTLVIEAMGFGIVMPVMPEVIRKFITDETSVATTYGYFVAVYAALQFLSSPILGRLSDKFGRRPVLLISLFGAGIDYVFMAFAPTLGLLFVGRLISGVSGASYTVASAYIADVSDDSNRSKNFGLVGAGFGVGFILGPALGGLVASHGLAWPFLLSAGLNAVNFMFAILILPESLPKTLRRDFAWRELNPFRSLTLLTSVPSIVMLIVSFVLLQFAGQTHPAIWAIYTEKVLGWTPAQVGLSLGMVGVLHVVVQGGLTGTLTKWLGERKLVVISVAGEAVAFYCYGLATTGWAFYATLFVSAIFGAAFPAMQSLISREIPASQQGELQGALMSLTSLMAIFNPLVMTRLFATFSATDAPVHLPGAPYLFAGLVCSVAFAATLIWNRRGPSHDAETPIVDSPATSI